MQPIPLDAPADETTPPGFWVVRPPAQTLIAALLIPRGLSSDQMVIVRGLVPFGLIQLPKLAEAWGLQTVWGDPFWADPFLEMAGEGACPPRPRATFLAFTS